jgi:hypothetical protein
VRKKWRKSSDVPGRGLHLFPCRPCPGRHHRQVRDGGRLSCHTVSTWSRSIVILSLFCRSMKKVEMVVRFRLGASLQNAPAWLFVQISAGQLQLLALVAAARSTAAGRPTGLGTAFGCLSARTRWGTILSRSSSRRPASAHTSRNSSPLAWRSRPTSPMWKVRRPPAPTVHISSSA